MKKIIFLLLITVFLAACGSNTVPFSAVRIQGAFANLVPARSILAARAVNNGQTRVIRSARSLISQTASISVILAGFDDEEFDEPGVVTTTEVAEEGGFVVDVPTAAAPDNAGDDYLMLAHDPALGIGVEQLIGFIELPAGANESSAGWPLGGAALGTTVDLGTMGGDSGDNQAFLAASDQNQLYDLLGADQTEVLFQAQRDNYLKVMANQYLNQDATVPMAAFYQIHGPAESFVNSWADPSDLLQELQGYYTIEFDPDSTFSGLDELIGSGGELRLFPPDTVTQRDEKTFGPDAPIQRSDIEESDSDNAYIGLDAPIVEGDWTLIIDADVDRVDNLKLFDVFDSDGNLVYFYPIIRINVDEATALITSFEVRWYTWNPDANAYQLLDIVDELPLFGEWEFTYEISGATISVPLVQGIPVAPPEQVYLEDPPAGEVELEFVEMRLGIGGSRLNYMYFK
jgi:hypothetical protein